MESKARDGERNKLRNTHENERLKADQTSG